MFDRDKWQEIFSTIQKHKLRTFLTSFGVFWGIFMFIFLLGSGKGLENGTLQMFGNMATNSMFVWTNRTAKPYKGLPAGRTIRFTNDDMEAIRMNFPEIYRIAPRLIVPNEKLVRKGKEGTFEIRGEWDDLFDIMPYQLLAGRFLNDRDEQERRKVVVIGERVKEVLFEKENAVGQYLRINGNEFLVVGVFNMKNPNGDNREELQNVFMPLSAAQRLTNQVNKVSWFVCTAQDNVKASRIEEPLKLMLGARHHVSPEDKQAIRSFNMEKEFSKFQGLFNAISVFVGVIGLLLLAVGIVGVSNIMMITVKERTKEIGIRKALGATPNSIVSLILLESIFITTVAGYIGLLFGTGIIAGVAFLLKSMGAESEFFANPEIKWYVAVGALCLLVLSGIIAGWIPARHAANINPVVALRDE